MESNGKSVTKNGQQVDYQTGVCHHPNFIDNGLILLIGIANHLGRSWHQWATFVLSARASRDEADPGRFYRARDDPQPHPWVKTPPNPLVQLFRTTRGFGVWKDGRTGPCRAGTGI